jgi:PhnB protein
MAKAARKIPEGHNAVSPYLIVDGGARALEFYKRAFNATEKFRMGGPDGKVGHAEMVIGDTVIMLADEHPDHGAHGPSHYKGSPISLHLYVEDVDKVAQQAVAAGATLKEPVTDMFYGDRRGAVEDPFGYTWHVATHMEDLTPDEINRRMAAQMGAKKG